MITTRVTGTEVKDEEHLRIHLSLVFDELNTKLSRTNSEHLEWRETQKSVRCAFCSAWELGFTVKIKS